VLPGKGGDILAVRSLPAGVDVLWSTPWGLRHAGAVASATDSHVGFVESYPGGWQTLFPNGGTATVEQGVELSFHGEATLVPWDWQEVAVTGGVAIELATCLVCSPFRLRRRVELVGAKVTVTEHFSNESKVVQEAMWSHHPAFGAPFLEDGCTVRAGARTFLADAGYDTPTTDLAPGVRSTWPRVAGRDGGEVDLTLVPAPDAGLDRFGYLLDLDEPVFAISNPRLGLEATLRWDADVFPHAWYWCEASGSTGFPWHQRAYVLAVEPASSHPGRGLQAARDSGGGVVSFAPGETRSAFVSLELTSIPSRGAR
jgi:hypothetical protein